MMSLYRPLNPKTVATWHVHVHVNVIAVQNTNAITGRYMYVCERAFRGTGLVGDQRATTYLILTLIVEFIHGLVLIWKITVNTFDGHVVDNGNALHM